MPYNDDAREPSSVTGKALGAVGLAAVLGGSGIVASKGIKAASKGIKKLGGAIREDLMSNVNKVAKDSSILQVAPKNVVPDKDTAPMLKNIAKEAENVSKNRAVGNGTDHILTNATERAIEKDGANILKSGTKTPDLPILQRNELETIRNPDMSKVTKNMEAVSSNDVSPQRHINIMNNGLQPTQSNPSLDMSKVNKSSDILQRDNSLQVL